jgi:small-conductance mechanosensitive channel
VIIGDRPFQVGDKIAVSGTYGEVTAIGLWSTRIVTPDDSLVSVPNAQVVASQVSNANSGALDCQVVTDLYLPGWVDTRRAQDIAYRAAVTSRFVYLKKPVVVLVRDEVHQTFLTHIKVKAYVQDIRHEFQFMSDVTQRAREAFVESGLLPAWHGAVAHANAPGTEPAASKARSDGAGAAQG